MPRRPLKQVKGRFISRLTASIKKKGAPACPVIRDHLSNDLEKIHKFTMEERKIIYNDSGIRSAHVNAFRATAVRGEIGLLFGAAGPGAGPDNEADVRVTNRIMLSPFVAKRLAVVLEGTVRSYERDYGPVGSDQPAIPARTPSPASSSPVPARPEISDEKAARMFELVKGLNVKIGIERSFKFFQGAVLADRFLMGFKRDDVSGDQDARILDVCNALGMPSDHQEAFRDNISLANIILFGFEGEGDNRLYKAYLEFGSRFDEVTPDNANPFLVHQGFKWDAEDNTRCARTDYTCFPLFTIREIMERVRGIYHPGTGRIPAEIAEGFLKSAHEKVGCHEMLYFEAGERDNPRSSFDLNIYRANMRMTELYPLFERICSYYSIPGENFHALYEPVRNRIFGHLSGGVDRHGRNFMTVYFGVKGSSRIPMVKS